MAADGDEERRFAEAEWASSGLADLLDRANAPIFALDMNGMVVEWNHQVGELTGVGKSSIMGKPLSDQVLASSQQALKHNLSLAAKGEIGSAFEMQLKAKGGEEVALSVGFSPQYGQKDQVVGVLCVGQTMPASTPQPPADAATSGGPRGGTPTESSSRKTKGMVMHELRSPLHGIIGLANTLSQDESPMSKPLKMIGTSAERVLELVTNLMDYWNLSEDACNDTIQDAIDVSVIVTECLTRCEQAKDKRGKSMKKDKVNIVVDMPKNIPPMLGEQQAISQMVYHLIQNALKFTHQGDVKITADHDASKGTVDIIVEDTGIGIGEGNTKRIFEPFQQEDTSESRRYEGIGLGLAIVREAVRIHRGSVDLQSTQGKGSTFRVTLPLDAHAAVAAAASPQSPAPGAPVQRVRAVKPSSGPRVGPGSWLGPRGLVAPPEPVARPAKSKPPPAAAAAAAPAAAPAPAQGAKTSAVLPPLPPPVAPSGPRVIMSVDDDHVNQEVMRSVLEPFGFTMVICMSGSECLEYMEKDKTVMPDLILLDLMMPGINGFDVLTEQRKTVSPEQLPIIMVSAKNQASSVVKGLELGCNDWIHKPFDRQELIARVQAHLRRKDTHIQISHLAAVAAAGTAEAASAVVMQRPRPVKSFTPITEPIDTSVLFVTLLHDQSAQAGGDAQLTRIFESFEILSEKFNPVRTEIVGDTYLAVSGGTEEETCHADQMLQLALCIEESINQVNRESNRAAGLQFKVGIHTDTHVPPIVDGLKGHTPRQYPNTSFFASTVRGAKRLVEGPQPGQILLSRSARCRLSADIENEIRDRGLCMVGDSEPSQGAPPPTVFCLTKTGSKGVTYAVPSEVPPVVGTQEGQEVHTALQGQVETLQSALQNSQCQLDAACARLENTEQQLAGSRAEVGRMRSHIDELSAKKPAQGKGPSTGSLPPFSRSMPPCLSNGEVASGAASTLFLQWQNAHLQAELRYYQEALALAKGQLQIQTMRSTAMERRQGALHERIEHLELDLGFKGACQGAIGPPLGGMGMMGGSFANMGGATGPSAGFHDNFNVDSTAGNFGSGGLADISIPANIPGMGAMATMGGMPSMGGIPSMSGSISGMGMGGIPSMGNLPQGAGLYAGGGMNAGAGGMGLTNFNAGLGSGLGAARAGAAAAPPMATARPAHTGPSVNP